MKAPWPLVKKPRLLKYRGFEAGWRRGKGFSLGELREAGLTIEDAVAIGIPVDRRRKSVWRHNVEFIKKFLEEIGYSRG